MISYAFQQSQTDTIKHERLASGP